MKIEISTILNHMSTGSMDKALIEAIQLYKNDQSELSIKLLAKIHAELENYIEGLEILNQHEKLIKESNDYDLLNNMGYFLMQNEEYENSIYYLLEAIKMNPKIPAAFTNIAEVYIHLRKFDEAKKFINQAIEKSKVLNENINSYLRPISLKADINSALGRDDKTINYYLEISNQKFNENIFYLQSVVDPKSLTKKLAMSASSLIENHGSSFKSKLDKFNKSIPLLFGLANYYQLYDKKLSEKYFHLANTEVFNILRYNIFSNQKFVSNIIETYEKNIAHLNSTEEVGSENFFIVGTPRSGTTLLESIITANEEVFAAGELKSFQDLCKPLIKLNNQDSLKSIIDKIKQTYIKRTKYLKQEFQFVVDKMPGNFAFIGLILKILPQSKIIRILRDPWDTAISLYKQRYVRNIPYSTSFFNLGVFFANFEAINLYWDHVLTQNQILNIRYEELVQNKDIYQSKIYGFLNIKSKYNEDKRTRFFAKTASIQQVKNDIHTSSLGKSDFIDKKNQFYDALLSQREYWKSQRNIFYKNDTFFGYSI